MYVCMYVCVYVCMHACEAIFLCLSAYVTYLCGCSTVKFPIIALISGQIPMYECFVHADYESEYENNLFPVLNCTVVASSDRMGDRLL